MLGSFYTSPSDSVALDVLLFIILRFVIIPANQPAFVPQAFSSSSSKVLS